MSENHLANPVRTVFGTGLAALLLGSGLSSHVKTDVSKLH